MDDAQVLLQDLPCGLGKSFVYLEMHWLYVFFA